MKQPQRPLFKNLVIEALQNLADPDYQQRVWIIGSATEVSSMSETTNALFGDSCLDTALEKNEITFSPEIDARLRELDLLLQSSLAAEAKIGTAKAIATPAWANVCSKARQILEWFASQS